MAGNTRVPKAELSASPPWSPSPCPVGRAVGQKSTALAVPPIGRTS